MQVNKGRVHAHKLGWVSALMLMTIVLTYCGGCGGGGGGGGNRVDSVVLLDTNVAAATGGTFTDDAAQPAFSLTIVPNGIQGDSRLVIERLVSPPGAGANQTAASQAFSISLTASNGAPPRLLADMVLEMVADTAPVHPQLGEIAQLNGTNWDGLLANFFRASQNTVVSLTRLTSATFRVVHRGRQLATGPGVAAGLDVFLNETFGNENFFGPIIGLHTLLNGTLPTTAVTLGVQVDITKVPQAIVDVLTGVDLVAKDAALANAATTQALIKAGAVIGVKGFYATPDPADVTMTSAGITCALCHVNVAPTQFDLGAGPTSLPIGQPQLDGIPNRQMDAGAILAATPFAIGAGQPTVDLLNSWGPGAFDIRALPDNPLDDGANNPTSNPPLWNFLDLQAVAYRLGWDGLFQNDGTSNNALASQAEAVYDLVMHGNGAFGIADPSGAFNVPGFGNFPPELAITPPAALLAALVAAEAAQIGNDLDTQKMLDVQTWMQSIASPAPGVFDEAQAEAGFRLFYGKANCVGCHFNEEIQGQGTIPNITDPLPAGDLANGIRIPSLRGVSHTAPYFHNHSAASLDLAVARFVSGGFVPSSLTAPEQAELVEYLKGL